jgi:hypothetical protein
LTLAYAFAKPPAWSVTSPITRVRPAVSVSWQVRRVYPAALELGWGAAQV